MSFIEAIILGITQGLTEFLPISSSGHLIIVPWLFGWETPGLAFDAALHLGTLIAVFAYFWREIVAMIKAIPIVLAKAHRIAQSASENEDEQTFFARLGLLIVIGSIPGGVIGLVAQSRIDDFFHGDTNQSRAIVVIAILLALFAVLLWLADRYGREIRPLKIDPRSRMR